MKARQFNNISYEPKLLGLTIKELLIVAPLMSVLVMAGINWIVSIVFILSSVIIHRNYREKIDQKSIECLKGKRRELGEKELKMLYPVMPEGEKTLVSMKGERSWTWELLPPDLEQLRDEDRAMIFRELKKGLNELKEDSWIRIESRGGKFFLNSNVEDLKLDNFKLVQIEQPLKVFNLSDECPTSAVIHNDCIIFSGEATYLIPVQELPSEIEENFLAGIGDYVLIFEKENHIKISTKLERKRNQIHGSNDSGPVNYKEMYGVQDIEALKSSMDRGDEGFWKVSIFLKIKLSSHLDASEIASAVESVATQRGLKLSKDRYNIQSFYLETIWGTRPKFKKGTILAGTNTSALSMLFPTTQDFMMSKGVEVLSTGHESGHQTPLYYDIADKSFMNGHLAVAGASGSGKSLFVQYLTDSYIENGSCAVICDRGRSFERLGQWHNASYLDHKINFLEFKDPKYLSEIVMSLMEGDKIDREEEGYLYAAIKEAVALGKTNSHQEFIDFLEKKRKGIKNYFSEFLEITTDEFADHKNTKILICEINDIDPKFHSAVFLYLFERFLNMPSHKIFVFEEIHSLLRTQGVRISLYFREQRKKGASCISITQSVNDNKKHDLMEVIWENSEHKAIFKHENKIEDGYLNDLQAKHFDILRRENSKGAINKNDQKSKRDYSEFVLSSSLYCKRVRLVIDPLKYAIYNTTPDDMNAYQNWIEVNGGAFQENGVINYRKTIEAFARLRYVH
jgi:hypothetical protein